MEFSSKDVLVEAIKLAKSPKMALDGVKMLLDGAGDYSEIFRIVLEPVWADASRRNRAIERRSGKNRLKKWPPRTQLEEATCQLVAKKVMRSRSVEKEFGKVLSSYEEQTIKRIYQILSGSQ